MDIVEVAGEAQSRHFVRTCVRLMFFLSLVMLAAIVIADPGQAPGTRGAHAALASSSSPFVASSPATTLAPSASTTTTVPATSAPGSPTAAQTGEAWASRWFSWLIGVSVLLGALALWPTVTRRRRPTPFSARSSL